VPTTRSLNLAVLCVRVGIHLVHHLGDCAVGVDHECRALDAAGFGAALNYAADVAEFDDVGRGLARLKLARELRVIARDAELLGRLRDAQEPPWPALDAALERERSSG
jgi:hypothetical protein